jgi:hypothetical protein
MTSQEFKLAISILIVSAWAQNLFAIDSTSSLNTGGFSTSSAAPPVKNLGYQQSLQKMAADQKAAAVTGMNESRRLNDKKGALEELCCFVDPIAGCCDEAPPYGVASGMSFTAAMHNAHQADNNCKAAAMVDKRSATGGPGATCSGGSQYDDLMKDPTVIKLKKDLAKSGFKIDSSNPSNPKYSIGTSAEVYTAKDFSSIEEWTKAGHNPEAFKSISKDLKGNAGILSLKGSGSSDQVNGNGAAGASGQDDTAMINAILAAGNAAGGPVKGNRLKLVRDLASIDGNGDPSFGMYSRARCFFFCEISQSYVTHWKSKDLDPNLK